MLSKRAERMVLKIMGLDMYLYAKRYESVSRWDKDKNKDGFYPPELTELGNDIFNSNFMSKETSYQIGYWRKANAIHKYFVDICAEGVDDCREMYVREEVLENLLKRCKEVLADHNKAKDLLPSTSGFFFGSTDYGEWYFQDIEYTKNLLEKVLAFIKEHEEKDNDYDIYYLASW